MYRDEQTAIFGLMTTRIVLFLEHCPDVAFWFGSQRWNALNDPSPPGGTWRRCTDGVEKKTGPRRRRLGAPV